MKKSLFCAVLAFLYFLYPLALRPAKADGYAVYAYIPTEQVYFYSDEILENNRQGLFRLPYSYYVRIIAEETDYYRVEYLTNGTYTQKIIGYCKKSEVIPVDYIPQMPYLYLTLDITYTLPSSNGKGDFSYITVTCAYYGDYTDGTKLYAYVLREETFGYVVKPSTLRYDKNTEYDEKMQLFPKDEKISSPASGSLSAGQITLLVLLCLLIPCLAALIIRPSAKQPPFEE